MRQIKRCARALITLVSTKTSLKRKVASYLAVTLSATLLLFAMLVVQNERKQLLGVAAQHVNQLSE